MSNTRDVMVGVAQLLAAANVGTFRSSGVYSTGETGIIFKIMPDGTNVPDRVIVLNAFILTADVSIPFDRYLLQVALRGVRNNPLDVDDLGDAVNDTLHGLTAQTLGASTGVQIIFSSSVPMGEDSLTRSIRADKYFIDLSVPPTSLRPDGGSWV